MRYLRSYLYLFDSPNWLANYGYVTLCLLSTAILPIFGQMLALGYLFEVMEAMHRQGHDRAYPDFKWERFVEYLVRGAQVFLVQLLATLPLALGIFVAAAGAMAIAVATSSDEPNVVVLIALLVGFSLFVLASSLLIALLIVPLWLRVGLGQDLGNTFSWGFIKDYARRMWWPTLLVELFELFSGVVVMLVGMAICCVGIYALMALPFFARMHLDYQLYEMYLERGGMPIPLKEGLPPIDDRYDEDDHDDDDRDSVREPTHDPAS